MSATQPIRDKNQIQALLEYFLKRNEYRNYLLVVMSLNTALRISDLLRITWEDVYDFKRNRFYESFSITEQKTGKNKRIAINKNIAKALCLYAKSTKRDGVLIKSRNGDNKAISRIQAYRIIRNATDSLKFSVRTTCHSLRKTFGYLLWKNGKSPTVIMEIYNHSNFAVTRRYLGVSQDDLDDCYHALTQIV